MPQARRTAATPRPTSARGPRPGGDAPARRSTATGLNGSTVGAQPLRAASAELLGTAILVFVGTSTVVATTSGGTAAYDLLAIVLSFGLVLTALVAALGQVSGCHLNPAITLGLAATARFPWRVAGTYVVAQLAGGILGSLATWVCFGDRARTVAHLGASLPNAGVPQWRAFVVELLVTFVLVLVVVSVASDDRVPTSVAPVAIGFALASAIFVAAPLSGGAVNPARALGPDLLTGHLGPLWLYLVAPTLGGVLAAFVHRTVLADVEPPA